MSANRLEEKIGNTHSGQVIPKQIHFIWFGGMLPAKIFSKEGRENNYQRNVLLAAQLNPDYQVVLWINSTTMSTKDLHQLDDWQKNTRRIAVYDLAEDRFETLPNLDLIKFECLYKNYAGASNIARMSILHEFGGVYMNTDLISKKGFGNMLAPLKTLQYIRERNGRNIINIYFMASTKAHPLYSGWIQFMRKMYHKVFSCPSYTQWISTADEGLYDDVMSYLSGGAMNYIFESIDFNSKEIGLMNFPLSSYVEIRCDRTWYKSGGADDDARWAYMKDLKGYPEPEPGVSFEEVDKNIEKRNDEEMMELLNRAVIPRLNKIRSFSKESECKIDSLLACKTDFLPGYYKVGFFFDDYNSDNHPSILKDEKFMREVGEIDSTVLKKLNSLMKKR